MDRIWQSRSRLALEIRVKWRAVYSAQQAREKGKVDVEQDQGRSDIYCACEMDPSLTFADITATASR